MEKFSFFSNSNGLHSFGNIKENSGIFQGDSLSTLLFCLALFLLTSLINKTQYTFLSEDIITVYNKYVKSFIFFLYSILSIVSISSIFKFRRRRSFIRVLRRDDGVLPLLRLVFLSAFCRMALAGGLLRHMCPSILRRLCLNSKCRGGLTESHPSFLIISDQRTFFNLRIIFLWKESVLFLMIFESAQALQPYKSIEKT